MLRRRLMLSGEKQTVALLHCDTTIPIGQEVTITDEVGTKWVKKWNKRIDAVSNSKFGTGCYQMIYEGYMSDRITATFDEALDWTKNGCTIEFWVKFYEMSADDDKIFGAVFKSGNDTYEIISIYNNINRINGELKTGQYELGGLGVYDWQYEDGVHEGFYWNHVAITIDRSGNTSFFINGNLIGRMPSEYKPWKPITSVFLQAGNYTLYFDEIRISRCVRYTEDFTPPTAPFEVD